MACAGFRSRVVVAASTLTAGCFEPLYGTHHSVDGGLSDSVHSKFAAVDIPTIRAPLGSPVVRIAVNTRNELEFDLHGGAGPTAPTHRLVVNVGTTQWTVVIDPINGRPNAQIDFVVASYTSLRLPPVRSR